MPTITLASIHNLWTSLRRFPWPTITFLALVMSAWGWWNYKAETDVHTQDLRLHIEDVKQWMKEHGELQQQTIQSQNRLIDELTRQKAVSR